MLGLTSTISKKGGVAQSSVSLGNCRITVLQSGVWKTWGLLGESKDTRFEEGIKIKLIVPQYQVQQNPVLPYVPRAQRKLYPQKARKLSIEKDTKRAHCITTIKCARDDKLARSLWHSFALQVWTLLSTSGTRNPGREKSAFPVLMKLMF